MEKILTIIIPSYNMEKYIYKCCESLVVSDNNLKKIEVIVVNDGSKDSTSTIANKFQEKYPNTFFVIDKENGNYGSCINTGLKIAHGKYIKILDADDTFYTKNFEEYISLLNNTDVDLILSDFDEVDIDEKVFLNVKYPFEPNKISSIDSFSEDIIPFLAMHAVAYKTDNIKTLNYIQSEGISYTDQEWIFLPMANVRNFIYFNKPLYKYLVGRDGQTVSSEVHAKNIDMEMKVVNKIIQDYLMHTDVIAIGNKRYIEAKLQERCCTLYHYYLIDFRKNVNQNDLINFDKYLKESLKNIYDKLSDCKDYSSFKYIYEWRQNYSTNTFGFMRFLFFRKLHFFIKRKIHKNK